MKRNKIKKEILNTLYLKAKESLKNGDLESARDNADMGIYWTALQRQKGMEITEKIEGVRIETWLMRFWVFLENNDLILE